MLYRFRPPKPSPPVRAGVNLLYPLVLGARERVCRLVIAPQDRARLEGLRGRRALLLPNHPSETEPSVLVGIAREMGEGFFYAATHELFRGFDGWVVQRMGAFSIRRGWPDRRALRTAVGVLADDPGGKLVLFPEGETHMCGDRIQPLHRGAAQIAFWALEAMAARGDVPCLPAVPVIVRYRYVGDARPALARRLARLEGALGVAPRVADADSVGERLRRAGIAVLGGVETEYGLRPAPGATVDERVAALYRWIARRVASVLHAPDPGAAGTPVYLGMRALFNAAFEYRDGLAGGGTRYERRLHARRLLAARACLADLGRVQNFMAIREQSLAAPLTAERAGEVLFRLEKEVYGEPLPHLWREAVVRVGEPVEMAEFLPAYRAGRKAAVEAGTRLIEARMRELLAETADVGTPVD